MLNENTIINRSSIIGERFGSLVVIEHLGYGVYLSRCDCGRSTTSSKTTLTSGMKRRCRSCPKMFVDYTDYQFNNIKVLSYIGSNRKKNLWLVECQLCNHKFNMEAGRIKRHKIDRCSDCSKYQNGLSRRGKSGKTKYTEIFPTDDKILGYICGIIATDGCLKKAARIICLAVQIRDVELVEFFAKHLVKENYSIKSRKRSGLITKQSQVSFSATLPKLYQYCLDMGITPAKTYTLNPKLDDKSEDFRLYFLRGVIDGDGGIHVHSKRHSCSITITSASREFLLTLQVFFGGSIRTIKPSKSRLAKVDNHTLSFTGSALTKLSNILPEGLSRKNDKLMVIKQLPATRPSLIRLDQNNEPTSLSKLINKYSSKLSPQRVASRLRLGWSEEDALTKPLKHRIGSIYHTVDGVIGLFPELVRHFNVVSIKTASNRLSYGWSVEKAVKTPPLIRRSRKDSEI